MGTFAKANPQPAPGDGLRDLAADLLSGIHGKVETEHRVLGKKADIFYTHDHMGKPIKTYVEVKDYSRPLTRKDVEHIATDYRGVILKNSPALLLIVTRSGLTPDAQAFVELEHDILRHRTIWNLEDKSLGLADYTVHLHESFGQSGLDKYYIPSQATKVVYDVNHTRKASPAPLDLLSELDKWIGSDYYKPIAILGGYGAGKTCFSKKLVSHLAKRNLDDPTQRKPILVKLGEIADYSRIEGLLGAQFTHEFEARGFSFQRFMKLNALGRFVLVLDGFDEMKHAMTWAVFRSQVSQLNMFVTGKSKVVLLGRPSAFLTDHEHIYVLRGRRPGLESSWVRIPEWPEFNEYELAPFDDHDVSRFCHDYLSYIAEKEAKEEGVEVDYLWVGERAAEVALIAKTSPDLFGKPVHSKILVELATRRDVDLDRLKLNLSKWDLYSLFFAVVFDRELDKRSRQPMPEGRRKKFLQDVALWLWRDRDGATSFMAEEVPDSLLAETAADQELDRLAVLRELLAGPFIERKHGDVFYFVHRSFAEYLVADWMAKRPPVEEDQSVYSRLYSGAVVEFLAEAQVANGAAWASSLGRVQGLLSLPYLEFVSRVAGSYGVAESLMPLNSPWAKVINALGRSHQRDATPASFIAAVAEGLAARPTRTETSLLLPLTRSALAEAKADAPSHWRAGALALAGALISCTLTYLQRSENDSYMIVTREALPVMKVAYACMKGPLPSPDEYAFHFNWRELWKYSDNLATIEKVGIDLRDAYSHDECSSADITLSLSEIKATLRPQHWEAFEEIFVRRRSTFQQLIATEIPKSIDMGEVYLEGAPREVRAPTPTHPDKPEGRRS